MKSFQKPSRVSGLYVAVVGKQEAKFSYEHLERVALRAPSKVFWRAVARIPGADSCGGGPAGEGDREVAIVYLIVIG